MARRSVYVRDSDMTLLQIRQPFHSFLLGIRQNRQPFQGRRISRMPTTTPTSATATATATTTTTTTTTTTKPRTARTTRTMHNNYNN